MKYVHMVNPPNELRYSHDKKIKTSQPYYNQISFFAFFDESAEICFAQINK